VSSKGLSTNVFVHSRFVVDEIFVNCEGSGDRSVFDEVSFDGINGVESVGRSGSVFVTAVVSSISRFTRFRASRGYLSDIRAIFEVRGDVVSTFFHSVGVTGGLVSEISSSHNSGFFEPVPGGHDLSSIASHREAGKESTAPSGIGNGHKGSIFGLNASSIVESFGSSVGPARSTVRLVSNMSDDGCTFGPGFISVEGGGEIRSEVVGHENFGFDSVGRVNDSSHHFFNLGFSHSFEFVVVSGSPSGFRVGID